jgi:hypothetical protein
VLIHFRSWWSLRLKSIIGGTRDEYCIRRGLWKADRVKEEKVSKI